MHLLDAWPIKLVDTRGRSLAKALAGVPRWVWVSLVSGAFVGACTVQLALSALLGTVTRVGYEDAAPGLGWYLERADSARCGVTSIKAAQTQLGDRVFCAWHQPLPAHPPAPR